MKYWKYRNYLLIIFYIVNEKKKKLAQTPPSDILMKYSILTPFTEIKQTSFSLAAPEEL